jgi:hypothetical protein
MTDNEDERPLLRVVRGNPRPDEVAALVAVVSALASAGSEDKPRPRSEWAAHHHKVRGAHRHGGNAWRMSAR